MHVAVFVTTEKSLLGTAGEHSALYTVSDAKIPATGLGAYIANEISSNVVAALAETAPKSIAHIQVGASPLNITTWRVTVQTRHNAIVRSVQRALC
jgi:hypothetical protein